MESSKKRRLSPLTEGPSATVPSTGMCQDLVVQDNAVSSPQSSNHFKPETSPYLSLLQRGLQKNAYSQPSSFAKNCPLQSHKVTRNERAEHLGKFPGYRGCTVWLTGLSGAGKTTIAFGVEKVLTELGLPTYGLDGDIVRNGLCKNLGFSKEDRSENIRRVAEVAKLFADMGAITLASFISPYKQDRDEARAIHEKDQIPFFEIYLNTPLSVCEQRDPKKFYEKARAGKLKGFTGVDSEYEAPDNADLVIKAGEWSEAECVQRLMEFLQSKGIIPDEAIRLTDTVVVKELFVKDEFKKHCLLRETAEIPKVEITEIDRQWLQVLAEGWATPLTGFMRERQYLQCLHHGLLFDLKRDCVEPGSSLESTSSTKGSHDFAYPVNQSIPIVLPINDEQKNLILTGNAGASFSAVCLCYNGTEIAILRDLEVYPHRKEERVARQFAFTDRRHPTIDMIMNTGDWLLGGDVEVLDRIRYDDGLDEYRVKPMELRERFREKKCDAVFAFQLRNPIHNGHALLMRETREKLLQTYKNPMLLLHPLGGWTKDDDVPLDIRMQQHQAVLEEGVLDPNWTILAIFPSPMLYAGPTEVLTMAPGLSGLHIIPFRVAAYDKKKKEMSFFEEGRKDDFLFISGTKMRQFAKDGIEPPDGFMAPKAWKILASFYKKKNGGTAP